MISNLDLKPEVAAALKEGQPVVALESTIISHGMPYPKNLETALELEAIVRREGAIPATIAVIGGRYKAGLDEDELEYLGNSKGIKKASRRDLPVLAAMKQDGATTVASTMIIAALAGIRVFVTGGIGGVHRGAGESFDISADLTELAQTDVAVVCAGVKSILDIGLTLEVLETYGVPVLGYRTDEFPAFYTRKSGFRVDSNIAEASEIAAIMKAKWDTGLRGAVLVGNPVPEDHAMDESVINSAIEKALDEADCQGIHGKEITPFLLSKIAEITEGESLESNIHLVCSNAELGARIAIEYQQLL